MGTLFRQTPNNGYPFPPKWPLKMGTGLEASAAHPRPNNIWVPPPREAVGTTQPSSLRHRSRRWDPPTLGHARSSIMSMWPPDPDRGARGDWLCLAQVARGPHCSLLSERRNEILAQRTAHWTLNFDFWLSRCCLTNAYIYIYCYQSFVAMLIVWSLIGYYSISRAGVSICLAAIMHMFAISSKSITSHTRNKFIKWSCRSYVLWNYGVNGQ